MPSVDGPLLETVSCAVSARILMYDLRRSLVTENHLLMTVFGTQRFSIMAV